MIQTTYQILIDIFLRILQNVRSNKIVSSIILILILVIILLLEHSYCILNLCNDADFFYDKKFRNKNPVAIILSNPPVYKFLNQAEKDYLKSSKNIDINTLQIVNSPNDLLPEIIRSGSQYTGIGEAIALANLQLLFKKLCINNLSIHQSRLFMENEPSNLVILGGWISQAFSEKYIASTPFKKFQKKFPFRLHDGYLLKYEINTDSIIDTLKNSMKIMEIKSKADLIPNEELALITKFKHPWNNTTIIIAAGINSQGTQSAGNFISKIENIKRIKSHFLSTYGESPKWFQIVILSRILDNGLLGSDIEIKGSKILDEDIGISN